MFRNKETAFHVRELFIQRDEASIAGILNEVETKYRDKIILGSYPEMHNR